MKLLSNSKIKNSKVLMRVDFNVPIKNGNITDATRILNALPSIQYLLKNNNAIVLISHLGRPKRKSKKESLFIVYKYLVKLLEFPVFFSEQIIGDEVDKKKENLKLGEVLLIENIRFENKEKLENNNFEKNIFFAKQLANQMDFFVNEAFACSHRESSSMTLLPMLFSKKKLAGFLLEKEIKYLNKAKHNSLKPFTAIIGGSKISTKIKLIKKLLIICDNIILGGAMAHTFIVFLKGKVGSSLFEEDQLLEAANILKEAKKYNCKIHLPIDCVSTQKISNNQITQIRKINKVPNNEMSVDIGPDSLNLFHKIIIESKTILWNGPMGIFELSAFSNGTRMIANSISKATELGSYSIIGGGDSIAAINSFNENFKFSYLSTGGGAMLEFFKKDNLPAISALAE